MAGWLAASTAFNASPTLVCLLFLEESNREDVKLYLKLLFSLITLEIRVAGAVETVVWAARYSGEHGQLQSYSALTVDNQVQKLFSFQYGSLHF